MENAILTGLLHSRRKDSRKGENGKLLVIGGSNLYYGAPALVSLAALKAGADLVYTLVPDDIAPTVASYSPDLIVWGYPGKALSQKALKMIKEAGAKADALVIGNGLSQEREPIGTARRILSSWEKPVVIDADVLGRAEAESRFAIYTPHDGEFERMSGRKPPKEAGKRAEAVKEEARRLKATVLLKGPVDIISDGKKVFLNKTGNEAMTCGGTGDVLAGIVGCFLSQGYAPTDSARLGAHVNGLAGDLAFTELGYSLRASDLLNYIGKAMGRCARSSL